jgi:hypothetical protein
MIRISKLLTPCILLLCLVLGCGDRTRAPISGTVTLDGQPLEKGSILFVPMDGATGTATGGEIENGHYQLSGKACAAVGWNRVEIRSPKNTGKQIQYAPGTTPSMEVIQLVAPRFNAKSSLKTEIKPEANTADFEVASK